MTAPIPVYDMAVGKRGLPRLVVSSRKKVTLDGLQEPRQFAEMFRRLLGLGCSAEERFCAAALDAGGGVKGAFEVAHGSYDRCHVDFKPLFARLLLSGASTFVDAHNHPTGRLGPSGADRELCERLDAAARLLGLGLVDFLIVTADGHFSFYENGMFKNAPT